MYLFIYVVRSGVNKNNLVGILAKFKLYFALTKSFYIFVSIKQHQFTEMFYQHLVKT